MSTQSTCLLTTKMRKERCLIILRMRVVFGYSSGKVKRRGNKEIRSVIYSQIPPPSEKAWELDTVKAAKVLARKKNWSAPGPNKLTNFWWKKAKVLREGMATLFQTIANTNVDYPAWFSKGKTTLLPKPEECTSNSKRPITFLNTLYKWFMLCLLGPAK